MKYLPKLFKKTFGLLFVFISAFVFFTQILFPEISSASQKSFVTPVTDDYFKDLALKRLESFSFIELKRDNELPGAEEVGVPEVFYLSIPKLGISKALVETNSIKTRVDEMLGHYLGSNLPGQVGNTFIYGHSSLPALYDPTNYKTIFTHLQNLDGGDEVIIEYNDETIKYVVQGKQVLLPDNVEPLALTHLNYSSLTLMTCVPPGKTDHRLLVFAKKVY